MACDFETTTENQFEIDGCTRVWWYGYQPLTNQSNWNDVIRGTNLEEFMEHMKELATSYDNPLAYFHNLKFDGSFILYWLLENGYQEDRDLSEEKTFSTIITGEGQWYQIKVRFENDYPKTLKGQNRIKNGQIVVNKRYITFEDSCKKVNGSIETLAKQFGLTVSKSTIDYCKYRPVGYKPSENEEYYGCIDVNILAQVMYHIIIEEKADKMTIGSDAMDFYKETTPNYQRKNKYGHGGDKLKEECFREIFPCLDNSIWGYDEHNKAITYDDFSRRSYKGGWTYLKDNKVTQIGDGLVYDVNSLYPSVMHECPLPYGMPIKFEGCYDDLPQATKNKYNLYITKVTFMFEIKEKHLPCIQIKKSFRFNENEYLTTSDDEPVTLYLVSTDLELIKDHYNITNVIYQGGLAFKSSDIYFKDYINHWANIKEQATISGNKGQRQYSKYMQNNLYGKFATNPEHKSKHVRIEDDRLQYETVKEERDESIYTPVACFVTAWARNKTIRSAQANYDRFIYADTDSIHLSGLEQPKENEYFSIHQSKLGKWKCEMVFHKGKYLRQKTYMESPYLKDGKVLENPYELDETCVKSNKPDIKCCGLPDGEKGKGSVTYDNFNLGQVFKGSRKIPKNVKGGVVLHEHDFEIRQ